MGTQELKQSGSDRDIIKAMQALMTLSFGTGYKDAF